ncbi:hypothetical protein [Castellaniella sp.]|uniref:hypothetical protein n=1 Tax=Castellaniella sp. TaxID=1955812 RepID=UPI002AFF3B1E|nr:hypothetical protein [Castellaniella sp.]
MKKLLDLPYKGNRNYLHGSDIFNSLSSIADDVTGEKGSYIERLSFRGFARKSCFIETISPDNEKKVVGEVRYRACGMTEPVRAFIIETEMAVTGRATFNEASIVQDAVFDAAGSSAQILFDSEYSVIENIIALTKFLNYSVVPDVDGKWVFGQLDLMFPLVKACENVSVHMVKLINNKFSVNNIYLDKKKVGSIRFIVGAP